MFCQGFVHFILDNKKAHRSGPSHNSLIVRSLPVLTVLHQIVYHCGIRERRCVAEITEIVLGDLAQDAAHDFAGPGFR